MLAQPDANHKANFHRALAAMLHTYMSKKPGAVAEAFAELFARAGVSTDPQLLKQASEALEAAFYANGRSRSARSAAALLSEAVRRLVKRYSGDPPRADALHFIELFYNLAARLRGWSPDGTLQPTGALGMFLAIAERCRDENIPATEEEMIEILFRFNKSHRLGLGSITDIQTAIWAHLKHVPLDYYMSDSSKRAPFIH